MIQWEKLCDDFAKKDILDILLDTENMDMKEWKKYKYKIAYRVLHNWLSRRYGSGSTGPIRAPKNIRQ